MGLRDWLNKPAEPGTTKWYLQTGEKNPLKVAKGSYEYKKQQYKDKMDKGEKVLVGKFLILFALCFCIISFFNFYSNIVMSFITMIGTGFFTAFFFFINKDYFIGEDDGES